MPEKNKTYRARIEGYTSEGLGVARIDGQAVSSAQGEPIALTAGKHTIEFSMAGL